MSRRPSVMAILLAITLVAGVAFATTSTVVITVDGMT